MKTLQTVTAVIEMGTGMALLCFPSPEQECAVKK
jgi:hypothetical protein